VIPLEHILALASALFGLGLMGLFLQTNFLRLLLALEAMFNGAAFGFVGTAVHFGSIDGHVMFIIILSVAAVEASVALAVLLNYNRIFKTLDIAVEQED
jgi:NADH-quinone oxidoreductase subunit K